MQLAMHHPQGCNAKSMGWLYDFHIARTDHMSGVAVDVETTDFSHFCNSNMLFFVHYLSHLGEGLPQLAYNQAETPGR